jgi:hypothetical protein
VLDAPGGNLSVHSLIDFLLYLAYLLGNFWPAADNMQRRPGKQSRYGIEV